MSRTALLCIALVLVPTASAADKVIGQGIRLKGSRVWYAQGKAVVPKSITASIVPVPAQAVKVQWAVVCQKPNPDDPAMQLSTKSKTGQTRVHAAATVKLALPYAKPPKCIATVYATLAKSGRLTLRLVQT